MNKKEKMSKREILEDLKVVKEDEKTLKQELLSRDGRIIFKGLDWIKEGVQSRMFDEKNICNNFSVSYSTVSNTLSVVVGSRTFSCLAQRYGDVIVMFMDNVRDAKGRGVELMQDIILDKIISDAKVYGVSDLSSSKKDTKSVVEELVRIKSIKEHEMEELAKNKEPIMFTKRMLKRQLMKNSLEGKSLNKELDIKYLPETKKMAVTYKQTCPFMCQAEFPLDDCIDGIFIDDRAVLNTSFADICNGSGSAKEKVMNATVDAMIELCWGDGREKVMDDEGPTL